MLLGRWLNELRVELFSKVVQNVRMFYAFFEMSEMRNCLFRCVFLRRFDINVIYKPRNSSVELFAKTFVCETYSVRKILFLDLHKKNIRVITIA